MAVLVAIVILALLVIVHEAGHFLAARLQGIYATQFSVGFGPVLWKYQGPLTEYSLRALPLGGFVGFPDDDPESGYAPEDPNLLRNRPLLDRGIVISAGVVANLVFAYVLLVVQLVVLGVPQASLPGILLPDFVAKVTAVSPDMAQAGVRPGDDLWLNGQGVKMSLANDLGQLLPVEGGQPVTLHLSREGQPLTVKILPPDRQPLGLTVQVPVAIRAGLEPGDVILAADGVVFGPALTSEVRFKELIGSHGNQPVELQVRRGNQDLSLTVTPHLDPDGQGRIGVALSPNGSLVRHRLLNPLQVLVTATNQFHSTVNLILDSLGQLLSNFQANASQVAGPVGIVAQGAKIAQQDPANLVNFAVLISVSLAIINILPLPALDGGQMVFLLIEGLRGRPLPARIQEGVMQTGLVLLMGLGMFLIIRDTANLLQQ